MSIVTIFIIGFYVLLILFLKTGVSKLKSFALESLPSITQFSIIVPFRDEAGNLENLLQSFCRLEYPKEQFEIILINDFSSDSFLPVIEKYKKDLPNLHCIDAITSDMSPKKAALSLGISKSTFDWIVTTDADCEVPKNWLQAYNQKIVKDKPLFVSGLVKFSKLKSFLDRFQALDLLSLQATLLGTFGQHKPMLCHGANLCYSKALFYELNGFTNHQNIASGDDVFLLEAAMQKYPKQVAVINSLEAVVTTHPEPTLKALLAQRARWAAKVTSYNNWSIKLVGLVVFTMNSLLVGLAVLSLLKLFSFKLFLFAFLIKFNADALVLYRIARFFKQEQVLKSYLLSSLLYPLFSVTSAFLGLTKGYTWKKRYFRV